MADEVLFKYKDNLFSIKDPHFLANRRINLILIGFASLKELIDNREQNTLNIIEKMRIYNPTLGKKRIVKEKVKNLT